MLDLTVFFLDDLVNIEAVTFIGRNSSRRGMRLNDVTKFFQIRHLISDRRGAELQIRVFGNRSGSHRLTGFQIRLDNRF